MSAISMKGVDPCSPASATCFRRANRSALLTGLMLIDEGYAAEEAIDLIRDLRSAQVL
jgi:hypothetical protein